MICKSILVFQENEAEFTFPGFVSMRCFVNLPLLIVKEGLVAQITRVAVFCFLGIRTGRGGSTGEV